ncbi:MAE_28990/MAE_18760 family HEPN-like nuclease [Commensalibacter communis]|uniref:MAE_28990/MAE_18760 family HEPN-like nuclease n=1 Tax=Commensalibacter communis TaxID=2972786 RepID=UPI0022FF980C|nr:MAE_28990/MAE_18760 family HEPN-like nuclease [Commensalibacter communis]CAI3937282.1 unnamed protein product [Commensalibacter communis]CAI3940852.1 unnamed protein product [Commensalibacter communis]
MEAIKIDNETLNKAYLDYVDRHKNVSDFFSFIDFLENHKTISIQGEDKINLTANFFKINKDLIQTIQSSGFLLLYNLIESTTTSAIDSIYETLNYLEVQHQRSELEQHFINPFIFKLNEKLRKTIIERYAKSFSDKNINQILTQKECFFFPMTTKGYDKRYLFNGNIDCRLIDDIAKKQLGIQITPYKNKPYDPKHILQIKTIRNDLSHGVQAFHEASSGLALGELRQLFTSTTQLLNSLFSSIDLYLRNECYLEKIPER